MLLVIAFWLLCGLYAFGLWTNFMCKRFACIYYEEAYKKAFPALADTDKIHLSSPRYTLGFMDLLLGPLGLAATIHIISQKKGPWGLKFRWWVPEEQWEDGR